MTSRLPSVLRAAVIRASISPSDSPRYRSGRGCRSERCSFSYAVKTGSIVLMRPNLNYIDVYLDVRDDVIEGVALDRLAPGGANQAGNLAGRHGLRHGRAGHVVNLLFLHGAVEVVGAEPERRLRHLDARCHPERLDVLDVVEHQP